MALAHKEKRILLMEDKDFGWLAFVAHAKSSGVLLIRYPASARRKLSAAVALLVTERGFELEGAFAVLQPGSVRISRPPSTG